MSADRAGEASSALQRATAIEPAAAGGFRADLPETWHQGKGLFGGLILSVLARAVLASEDDAERTLRSITGEIPTPVAPGPAEIEVHPFRRGSGLSNWQAVLVRETAGQRAQLSHASLVLGRARAVDVQWTPETPAFGRWRDAPVVDVAPPLAPEFTSHFEFRPTRGLPFSAGTEPVTEGWIRTRETPSALGPAELVAYADAWWPALFSVSATPRPIGTVAFTMQLLPTRRALDPSEPLFHRARAPVAADGFLVEFRELWSPAGELIALNQQTIAIIK